MQGIQDRVNEIIFSIKSHYDEALKVYKEIKDDENYTEVYKSKKRDELVAMLKGVRAILMKEAQEEIEAEKKKVEGAKKVNDSMSIAEKTLVAMERNNRILMTQAKVKGARVEVLRGIFDDSNYDDDVKVLIEAELNSRERNDEINMLLHEIKNSGPMAEIEMAKINIEQMNMDDNMFHISLVNIRDVRSDFGISADEQKHYF